ncbi:ATP-binding protein [Streptomyces bathyalis]|nr:tetratricopeptide repeat protein [Streptomyces bathyalis]
MLEVDPDQVDLRRYLALIDQARSLADSGNYSEALHTLDEAARQWGGEPVTGMPGTWAADLRRMVEEKNLAAVLMRSKIALRLGHYAEVIADLRPLCREHPADESLIEHLVLALYACGRTSEATRLLHHTSHHLLRELGTEPGEPLRRIHRAILDQVPATTLLSPAPRAETEVSMPPPEELPPDVRWVGRQEELARITTELTEAAGESTGPAVAAIDGMAGSGKTSLAVHAAHQLRELFPEGRLLLNLRGHEAAQAPLDPVTGLTQVLRRLGVPAQELPQDADELSLRWRTILRKRRLMLILDDAASTTQVQPFLPDASPGAVIITSRHRLRGLRGVRPIALDVLPRPDAIALVRHLLEEDATSMHEAASLVRLCGYLPLAIDIAASRLLARPSWSLSDLLKQLNHGSARLPELRDGHREVISAFEISYRALTPTQQLVFRRLGLHFGTEFGPPAAAALTGLPLGEVERVLEDLLTCHLISEPAPHRYRLHDLVREYARARAMDEDTEGVCQGALQRLGEHYLLAADRADRHAYPHRLRITLRRPTLDASSQESDPHQWFTTEGPNLLAALEYTRVRGTPHELAMLTHTLAGFLESEGYLTTAEPLLKHAVSYWKNTDDEGSAHARALLDLSSISTRTGNYSDTMQSAQTALDIARANHDTTLEVEALHQMSIPYWHTARFREALPYQQRALQLRLQSTDRLQQARSFNLLGMTYLHLDQHKDALKHFLEALSRFREVEDQRGQYVTLNNLAELYQKTGNLEQAERAYRQAIAFSQAMGGKGQHGIIQMNLANTLHASGRTGEALDLYRTALPALRSTGDKRSETIALIGIGNALHSSGRSEEALPHHTAALALARRIHAAREEVEALHGLAAAEHATGRLSQARSHLTASLVISQRIDAPSEEARSLKALAEIDRDHENAEKS